MATIKSGIEVTFVGGPEPVVIKFLGSHVDTILTAATQLKARYVVFVDEWDYAADLPIWSVFDVSRVPSKMMGQHVLPLPVKTFRTLSSDPAVMWAATRGHR